MLIFSLARFSPPIFRYTEFVKDCPNGEMTKDEFAKLYGQFFPPGDQTKFVDYIFNVFDEDKVSYSRQPTSQTRGTVTTFFFIYPVINYRDKYF